MAQPTPKAIDFLRTGRITPEAFDRAFGEGASVSALAPQGSGQETGQPVAQPAPQEVEVTAEVDEAGQGIMADIAKALPSGVARAIENTGDFVANTLGGGGVTIRTPVMSTSMALGQRAEAPEVLPEEEFRARGGDPVFGVTGEEDNIVPRPESTTGRVVEGVAQFLTDFIGAGKLLKPLGGAGKAATVARGAASGAIADFLAFDPQADRISNFIQQYPSLQNPVTDFLAAEPTDGDAEGRLKNALEGSMVGAAASVMLRFLKAAKAGTVILTSEGREAAESFMAKQAEELEPAVEALQEEVKVGVKPIERPETVEEQLVKMEEGAEKDALKAQADEAEAAGAKFLRRPDDVLAMLDQAGRDTFDPLGKPPEAMFNFARMESSDDILSAIAEVGKAAEKRGNKLSETGTKSLEQTEREAQQWWAEQTGQSLENAVAGLTKVAKGVKDITAVSVGARGLLQSLSSEISAVAKVARETGADADRERLAHLTSLFEEAISSTKAIQRESARTVSAGRINTQSLDLLALEMAEGNPKAIRQQLAWTRRVWDIHNEYWINSILSGPKTHIVNMTSNAIKTVLMPAQQIVGGAIGLDSATVREGFYHYMGLRRMVFDSLRFAGQSLRRDQNVLDPRSTKFDVDTHAIASQRQDGVGQTINAFGNFVRIPTRLLGAEDEFFKQLNFRANLYSRLTRDGVDKGLTGDDLAKFVEEGFERGIDDTGRGLDNEALAWAREATFTTELQPGTIGRSIQQLVIQHPALRPILPFIRTPTNILKDVGANSPLYALTSRFREEIAAGGRRAALAKGKLATGAMMWTGGYMLAQEGRITGAGPQNRQMRERLKASGWRPYSVVVTDEAGKKQYISFNRLDPHGMTLGLMADTYEIMQSVPEKEGSEILTAALTAIAHNLTDKSYLRGMTEVLNAVTNPDRFLERTLQSRAGSYVPTGAKQTADILGFRDPYMREVNSLMDAVRARTPGFSDALPPSRDWVTGEPRKFDSIISPFASAVETDNEVLKAISRVPSGIGAPSKSLGGKELTPEQYDRYVVLSAAPPGRKSLTDALADAMKTTNYQRADQAELPLERLSADQLRADIRVKIINRVVEAYRKRARRLLLKEFPDLEGLIRADKRLKQSIRRGNSEQVQKWLEELQQ